VSVYADAHRTAVYTPFFAKGADSRRRGRPTGQGGLRRIILSADDPIDGGGQSRQAFLPQPPRHPIDSSPRREQM